MLSQLAILLPVTQVLIAPPTHQPSAMYTQIQSTVTLPSFSPFLLSTRTLTSPIFKDNFTQNSRTRVVLLRHYHRKLRPLLITCRANSEGVGSSKNWEKWVPRNFLSADKVFKWISEATSSPIAQYISSPTTFLHSVDPRIKLVLLFSYLVGLEVSNFIPLVEGLCYL